MGDIILSKCGYRCDLCLAYQPNIEKEDRRKELSDSWFNIYGFRIPHESIHCEGCVSSDSPNLIDKNCLVRPCVVNKSIENCAECGDFACEKLKEKGVRRENIENKLDRRLDEYEYTLFVKPYESEDRLIKIREECSCADE